MGQSAIPAAIAAKDFAEMRAAIVSELVPVIPDVTDPQTWDPRELGVSGGNVWKAVIWQGRMWFRDDDSVDDHDEITEIVLLDGGHYVTDDVRFPAYVLSRSVDTPPDPDDVDPEDRPQYGQAWRVPDAANGDWAGHENEVAMWTARGWRYRPADIGDLHYIVDEAGYEHVNADEEWEDGIGAFALQPQSVRPNHLLIRAWSFENQTTTSPPSAGPAGEQYVVGPGATGAWSGHDGKIAWRPGTDGAFIITSPFVGEEGFDKSLNIKVRFSGTAWVSAEGAYVGRNSVKTTSGSTTLSPDASAYLYSASSAPTLSSRRVTDDVVLSYAAKKANNKLRFQYRAAMSSINTEFVVALFRDSEATAIDWVPLSPIAASIDALINVVFEIAASDAASHNYKIFLFRNSNSDRIAGATLTRRLFEVVEQAQ